MNVYRTVPTGFGRGAIAAALHSNPKPMWLAAFRLSVGLLLFVSVAFVQSGVLALAGIALVLSVLPTVRSAGRGSIERPALILQGMPKWERVRRTSWRVEADDAVAVAALLAARISDELGRPLAARIDLDGTVTVVEPGVAVGGDEHRSTYLAWGVDSVPTLDAAGDAVGIWFRMDPVGGAVTGTPVPSSDVVAMSVLANEGRAEAVLVSAASGV